MTPYKPTLALAIGLALVLKVTLAAAGGLESLDQFVKTVKSGRAEFTQSVTAPPKDGVLARPKNSAGSFEFARPNRFRFVYRKPFEQTIVADGQTLWLYDVDLNQVTARQQAQALSSTPAALIASAADVRALQTTLPRQTHQRVRVCSGFLPRPRRGTVSFKACNLVFAV